jgi:hypothetical protein
MEDFCVVFSEVFDRGVWQGDFWTFGLLGAEMTESRCRESRARGKAKGGRLKPKTAEKQKSKIGNLEIGK